MKYTQLLIVPIILFACQTAPKEEAEPITETLETEKSIEVNKDLITYEGGHYEPDSVWTNIVSGTDSLYSTIMDISTGVGKETTVELRYYLQEGEFFSGPDSYGVDTLIGSIIFHEKIDSLENTFTSSFLPDDAIGSIELYDYDGETWSLKFGGGDGTIADYTHDNELFKYYRCAGGTITNVYLP